MQISFQYLEDCPSHEKALERLQRVLNEEGVQAKIEVIKVETIEQAKKLHFTGSPTILVDGKDIDESIKSHSYALACRAYRLEDGRISPLPSEAMIRRAVRAAIKNP
ncbi:MAG TPA: DUF2703 domain-containing protein [Candidatus Bathyarchaeia archaeon]|nr:DUF2703 domain-containing protein [Candidatus Bathyarchaeia archaeon]